MAKISDSQMTELGLTDAAQLLQELGICKAFSPSGRVNGPNCQRFGHRNSSSGRWSWNLHDLVLEARKRRSLHYSFNGGMTASRLSRHGW